jgi:hypothetical protein
LAGLLYLLTVVTGMFSLIYVPSQLGVHGDALATVRNIAESESLFRLGILAEILQYVFFLVLPLVLYRLLSPVDGTVAGLMVLFAVVSVPIEFVAVANKYDVLALLDGSDYGSLLSSGQLQAKAIFLMDAYRNRILVAEVFWGLWLFPFGYLVFKSTMLPRFLGVLLMLGCFSYLVTFFGQTLFPRHDLPDFVMWPVMVAEIGTCLWLLVFGARRFVHPPSGRSS